MVERFGYDMPRLGRCENDAEHSYNLGMMAWQIIAKDRLPLDLDLVLKYALVHDLVEVYAGDAKALNDEQMRDKVAKEAAALQRLKNDDLTSEYAGLIEQYESFADEESRFVYGLDKLIASFGIIYGRLPVWREYGITREAWLDRFQAKIQRSSYLEPYLEQFLRALDANPDLLADEAEPAM